MRDLVWLGDSRETLQAFPKRAKSVIGYALHLAQEGHKHEKAKPFHGLNGVFEIAVPYMKDAYRALYALKIGSRIYILHVFMKKSKKGIATPQEDVSLIEKRFKEAKRLEEFNV